MSQSQSQSKPQSQPQPQYETISPLYNTESATDGIEAEKPSFNSKVKERQPSMTFGHSSKTTKEDDKDDSTTSSENKDDVIWLCCCLPKRHWNNPRVQKLTHVHGKVGKLIKDDMVEIAIIILIIANAIMMGLATFDFVTENPGVDNAFEIVDNIFLYIFTLELALRIFYYNPIEVLKDGWSLMDVIIISLSWAFLQTRVMRSFRILKAVMIFNKLETIRNVINALTAVLPKVGIVAFLLLLVAWMFAVILTNIYGDVYEDGFAEYDYFGRLDKSFFTLFHMMALDGWAEVARDVMDYAPWSWVYMVIYIILTGFILANLLIAVICESLAHKDEREKEEKKKNKKKKKKKKRGFNPEASKSSDDEEDDSDRDSDSDEEDDFRLEKLEKEMQDVLEAQRQILGALQKRQVLAKRRREQEKPSTFFEKCRSEPGSSLSLPSSSSSSSKISDAGLSLSSQELSSKISDAGLSLSSQE